MSITRETWTQCRVAYITGKGSLAALAARHGLHKGSVEKRARKEGWTLLRREYEAAQLAKLIPPPAPALPPAPVALDGTVSDKWLAARQEIYFRRNTELLDKARKLLEAKLDDATSLGADGLAKLTSALGGIVDAENKLLGMNNRRDKRRAHRTWNPEPEPEPEPQPTEPTP